MTDGTMIDRQGAEEAISDVTRSFLDAIDEVITDPELATRVKIQAQANILRSILQHLIKNSPIMPEGASRYFDTGL